MGRKFNVAQLWAELTRRCRFAVVAVSFLSLALTPVAVKLLDRADGNFRLAHGSKSRQASMKLKSLFPERARSQSSIVLIEAIEGTLSSMESEWCQWELSLATAIREEYPCEESSSCLIRSIESWCELKIAGAPELGTHLVSPSPTEATRAIFAVSYNAKANTETRTRLNNWISRRAKTLRDDCSLGGVARVGLTGFDTLVQSGMRGTRRDLENVDTRSLPIALFVMALTLRNVALILIPLLCMLFATVLEFAVMAAVATKYEVVSFAVSVMMTLTLAVSFDYSLFFCSRYLEARRAGRSEDERVAIVLESAGHTVVVSGTTLVACFLGLLCFPSGVLRGLAISVTVGLVSALSFNLTLTPAIFHLVGERLCRLQDALDTAVARVFALFATVSKQPDETYVALQSGDDEIDEARQYKEQGNAWERLTRVLWDDRRIALAVVLAVVLLSLPACMHALDLRELADPRLDSPTPSPAEHVYSRVERSFGGGSVAPYYVLFAGQPGRGDVLEQAALDSMDKVLYGYLTNATKDAVGPASVMSLSRLGERRLKTEDYRACFANASASDLCPSLLLLAAQFSTSDNSSACAEILLSGDAYSTSGFDWIVDARHALRRAQQIDTSDLMLVAPNGLYLDGTAAQLRDLIHGLYQSFPLVIIVTLSLVFCFLGLAFGSLAVPLRSVAGLCLTLSFSFGTCVIVYQRTKVDHISFLSTRGLGSGIAWLAPLICFSVIVGLVRAPMLPVVCSFLVFAVGPRL